MNDYKIVLLCNVYFINLECFTLFMGVLVEIIYGNGIMRIFFFGMSCLVLGFIIFLLMNFLDLLIVYVKMRCVFFIYLVLC